MCLFEVVDIVVENVMVPVLVTVIVALELVLDAVELTVEVSVLVVLVEVVGIVPSETLGRLSPMSLASSPLVSVVSRPTVSPCPQHFTVSSLRMAHTFCDPMETAFAVIPDPKLMAGR